MTGPRGFQQRLNSGPGFRTDGLLMMTLDPGALGYSEAQSRQLLEQLAARARNAPGVRSAALTSYMPLDGTPPIAAIVPDGFQFPPGLDRASVPASSVDEQYFETLGLTILSGRAFQTN